MQYVFYMKVVGFVMSQARDKLNILKKSLEAYGSLAVAFSGGVDSTFLLRVASEVLGDRVVAITAVSNLIPNREKDDAADFCKAYGIRQINVFVNEMAIDGFSVNPPDRCYICKKSIFTDILNAAEKEGISCVAEGSNVDDMGDYRPGMRAIDELKIRSPLREAGLTKDEIRELSKEYNLQTWDKPAFACLASRFAYGEEITPAKLKMVDEAEQYLADMGLTQFRVRIHGMMARIEVLEEDMKAIMNGHRQIDEFFKDLGFTYVSLDLGGYEMGSMNKVLGTIDK